MFQNLLTFINGVFDILPKKRLLQIQKLNYERLA